MTLNLVLELAVTDSGSFYSIQAVTIPKIETEIDPIKTLRKPQCFERVLKESGTA